VEIADLLTEISPDAVCGADLGYDPDFMALEQAALGKPEQQFGETIVPALEPNWVDVRARAEALFSRTKDLRVGVLLTRALLRKSEFPGLSAGLTLMHQLLERYWDAVFPRIEAEDDNDPTMRLNALGALIDPEGVLRELRLVHVIPAGAAGRVTVRDILVAAGKLPAGVEVTPSASQIQSTIKGEGAKHAECIEAVRQSLRALRDMQSLLNDRLGTDRSLDLKPITDIIDLVVKTCDSALGEAVADTERQAAASAGAQPASGVAASGDIRSREDAIRMLERVCEFMERTEPSHPAPLLIRRAQRLLNNKNFLEIMEDLAPDSLVAIKGIAGIGSAASG
jgi:type VI secretion system protein ImpA